MKVQPFDCGGIELLPENEWEESYLINLLENLHSDTFVYNKTKTDFSNSFKSFLLMTKENLDIVN